MIGKLNHVAIVVPDLEKATALYRDTLGATVSAPMDQPAHGVTVVFVELPNTKIELLYPLGDTSPVGKFLASNPSGGIHHVCYEVPDILAARDKLKAEGARVLGDGEPRIGAHDKPVLFLHPKDFLGTLVELEQALSMGWITAVAVYFVVWWTVLFAVLPWGAHTLDETDAGRAAGAPSKPRIGLKFLVTTVISAIVWVLIYLTITSGLISFRT